MDAIVTSSAPIPLAPEDLQILAVEGPTVAGHTCKVVVLGSDAPDLAALRASIAARLPAEPLLTRRLGGPAHARAWVPDDRFAIAEHVVAAPPAADLAAAVATLFEQRLDRERPLWRIDVVDLPTGERALVWRIHHALADGTAAMRMARTLLWDEPGAGSAQPAGQAAAGPGAAAARAADDARRRAHLAGFLSREVGRSRDVSPFDGAIGTRRVVAFSTVPMAALHDTARDACGATLNDAVLALVAGALRRWLVAHHGPLGDVRVRVPVSLHHEGDATANRDSFFSVALPLNEADPLARLRAVHAETTIRKADHDAETMDELLRELGRVSPRLRHFATRVEGSPRRFAVNVSNVPGPRTPVAVLGAPVTRLHSIAEIGRRHALRVAVVSFAGRLGFGFTADPALVPEVDALAAGVVDEAALLCGEH
jgi:WS/DGAT/MGAT family acyltransferase